MTTFSKDELEDVFLIINDHIEQRIVSKKSIFNGELGRYCVDDYGNGVVHWSIIDKPEDAKDRQTKEDLKWAEDRLSYIEEQIKEHTDATKQLTSDLAYIQDIIKTKGKSRMKKGYYKF